MGKEIVKRGVPIVLGITMILTGMRLFGVFPDAMERFYTPIILLFAGACMFSMIGWKTLLDKKFDITDVTSLIAVILGVLTLVLGVVTMFAMNVVTVPEVIQALSGFSVIFVGVLIGIMGLK